MSQVVTHLDVTLVIARTSNNNKLTKQLTIEERKENNINIIIYFFINDRSISVLKKHKKRRLLNVRYGGFINYGFVTKKTDKRKYQFARS